MLGPVLAHLFPIFLESNFYPSEWDFVRMTSIVKEKGTPQIQEFGVKDCFIFFGTITKLEVLYFSA